jgi:nucleoside 2-deoxyribosyltransferase
MAARRLKCFVAMAFGRDDCDTLYEKHIHPILCSLGIDDIRVDRRQHKDDLNNYIIRMLTQSDFALVDLTYARPSVYYEAGYAERQIPVVYTARQDHLNRAQADDRLRVHFDLEMKKIVSWCDPDDPTFSKCLKDRVAFMVQPLRRDQEALEQLEKDRQSFTSRSIASRCEEILRTFLAKLKSKRFWLRLLSEVNKEIAYTLHPAEGLIGIKLVNKTCHFACVLTADSFTQKQIKLAINRIGGPALLSYDQKILNFQDHYFFCSLRNLPPSRLTSFFQEAYPKGNLSEFQLVQKLGWSEERGERQINIHLLSPVDSSHRLLELMRAGTKGIPDNRTNRYTFLLEYEPFGTQRIQFDRKHSANERMHLKRKIRRRNFN